MSRDVPECSGMFRNVPCSGFYRRPLSHAMCHVLSATGLTPLFYNTVLLSSTVQILKYSRIHEIVIKYNVRKTVDPILFRLRPLKVLFNVLLIKIQRRLESRGYSLKWPIRKGSTLKGYHFQALSIWEGWDFTCWSIWKDRENCRFGW